MASKSYRSKLVELFTRLITFDKEKDVYLNGDDNAYPERIERVINNSTTAKMCANRLATYVYGRGFTKNPIVNKPKNLTLNDILRAKTESIKYHKGYWLHVNYDIAGEPNYLDVLPYKNNRTSKKDDVGYKGATYYLENWGENKKAFSIKSDKAIWFYPFNMSEAVIMEQRKKDAKRYLKEDDTDEERIEKLIKHYRGQVLFVNLEPQFVYPLAYIDPAYNDADSEYRTSIFKNTLLRNGFVGKQVVTRLKSDDKKVEEQFEKDMAGLLGSEEAGNMLILDGELSEDGKELVPMIKFDEVKSNIDDKLFKHTEESVGGAIMSAYSVHPALVQSTHKLFGTSGKEMQEIKKEFQDTTEMERQAIEGVIKLLYKEENKILKLIEKPKAIEPVE